MKFFDEKHLQKYLKCLKDGGVFAYPTDTVWGIGCLPDCEKACKKIYNIKKRDGAKPLILMAASVKDFLPYIEQISPSMQKLVKKHWPGGLTIVVKKSSKLPDYVTSKMDTVGLRIPNHPVLIEFLRYSGPLATTSANISGEPSALTFEEAKKCVGDEVDFILEDFGYPAQGLASTVVLADGDGYKILRHGAIKILSL